MIDVVDVLEIVEEFVEVAELGDPATDVALVDDETVDDVVNNEEID